MAVTLHHLRPVAHVPVALGVGRQRQVAARIETCGPPPPAPVRSCGGGVEALRVALRAGPQALSTGGARLEARGL
jgi:hypothetical protein